jgi:hypothetical protein
MSKGITFDEVLDIIDSLPEEQRESLIEIVKNRLIDERRNRLAESIREAKAEYNRGEVKQGTVDDLMSELDK